MPRRNHVPPYPQNPHASGQARIKLNGQHVYLGPHGSLESRSTYDRVIAEWLARGRAPLVRPAEVASLTVAQAAEQYLTWARAYYQKRGQPTRQVARVVDCLKPVLALYRTEPAAAFSPLKLKAVRETLVARDLARTYVNQLVACIVRVWKWLAAEELVPAATWQALAAVPGLKRSRTTARESEPIEPAPELAIDATKELLLPPVRAMVDLQLLTAMRPGEACQLRPADLERDGPAGCWIYRPAEHKTEHHGRSRLVLIGPRAQALLTPFLFRAPDVFCFSPREAVEYALHGYNQPGERYTRESYCRAIARACVRAGCAHWHPNQLRHNAATRLREQFGWDVARIILGHSTVTTTAIYAADSLERAAQAMREAG